MLRYASRHFHNFRLLAVSCAWLALFTSTARALTWETPDRELTIEAGTAEVIVEFPFKNESNSAVTFTEVKAGCECSVPTLPEKPIAPGASGVLKITYHPGTILGTRLVPIQVHTDEPDAAPAILRIKATLEPVLTLTPVLLRWARHSPAETRTVVIQNVGKSPITSLTLAPSPDTVTARLAPGKKPGEWTLTLAPASTRDVLTARINLKAEVNGRTLTYSVYAVVR